MIKDIIMFKGASLGRPDAGKEPQPDAGAVRRAGGRAAEIEWLANITNPKTRL